MENKPSRADLIAAAGKTVPDIIRPDLNVLLVGINPGLYSAAIGHHFGRPGNRFWPALFRSGITSRLLSPYEEQELLQYGYGITNIVSRATATAQELTRQELEQGGMVLTEKVNTFKPRIVAVLGVTAYRSAFARPKAQLGKQEENLETATLWILPNPSGLNAHFDLDGLARMFKELKDEADMR